MNAVTAVFRRELSARRGAWLVGLASAAITGLTPLLPGLDGYRPGEILNVASATLAVAVGWGLAIGLGAVVFGSDLSSGRFGFFLARPVGSWSVWWGRMLAAAVLVLGCELLVLLPALVGGDIVAELLGGSIWPALLGLVAAPLLLLLVSHAASIMLRARTAWLVLDLIGVLSVVAGTWAAIGPLIRANAVQSAIVAAGLVVAGGWAALLVGGLVGVAVGRVDLRRTHGALSLTVWSLAALAVAGVAAGSFWLRSAAPNDLQTVELVAISPDGRWMEVTGTARGRLDYRPRFVLATSDGRHVALPPHEPWSWMNVAFSADSQRAVWLGSGWPDSSRTVLFAALDESLPRPTATTLEVDPETEIELSPDGSLLAFVDEATLSVYELAADRLVTAVPLPEGLAGATLFFVDRSTIRLYAASRGRAGGVRIAEVAVESGELRPLGRIEGLEGLIWTEFDPPVERMVVGSRSDRRADGPIRTRRRLFDATSGTAMGSVAGQQIVFLGDGRMATLRHQQDDRVVFRVTGPNGGVEREVGFARRVRLGGEAVPGRVLVSREAGPEGPGEATRVDLLDVETGELQLVARNLGILPTRYRVTTGALGMSFWHVNGHAACRFFRRPDGAIVRWDPESGDLVHVVGGLATE